MVQNPTALTAELSAYLKGLPLMGVTSGRNTAGATTLSVDISNLVFDDDNPLYLVMIFRTGSANTSREGSAIIKISSGTVVITSKVNATNFTAVSYNSGTKTLTLTCSDYSSVHVYGKLNFS